MTDERAPEAPRDERLLSEDHLAAMRAKVGQRGPSFLSLADAENDLANLFEHLDALTADRDALAEENARLVAALERFLGIHKTASGRSCMCLHCQEFRLALAGRAAGEA